MKTVAVDFIASVAVGVCGIAATIIESTGFDFSPLLNVGAVGVVLAWLMWRVEPRMKANEAATDRNTRATLLLLIEIPAIAEAVKTQAKKIVEECDEAAKKREGK